MTTFVDRVDLHVAAGNGGHGCASVHREKFKPLGGPDGGNGGRGGDVTLVVDPQVTTLLGYHRAPHRSSDNGGPGMGDHRAGAHGETLELPVPVGTVVHDADGAMLEPLGVTVHSVDLGHLPYGGSASVVGCGPIGLLLIGLLKAAGASSVLAIEPLAHRREAAARAGADFVVDPGSFGDGLGLGDHGVDVAFEAAGNDEGVGLAIASVRPGGRVVLAGIPGDDAIRFGASAARRKGLTIAMVRRMNEVYPRAIGLAERGVVDLASVVTSRMGLGEIREAFGEGARRTGLKVVIEPQR